jgi:digeranylgeranylglycerophospholipid reductase
MAIGDTVPTIDPLWGEGIRKGMWSARQAAVTADECLTPRKPDTSAEAMSKYDELWHEQVAPRIDKRLMMTQLLYLAPNSRYDTLIRDLKDLDLDTLSRVNRGSKWGLRKLLHLSDVPLLARFARQRLGG